jgi:methylmalonyl-CoA carboxyltransferase 1.3S subunit
LKLQITINGKTYTAEVEVLEDDSTTRKSGPDLHQSDSATPMPPIGAYTPTSTLNRSDVNEKLYRSPLTGLVIKVNVKPGQKVEANELIIVLEAMKMETSISTHHAGKVKSVNVAPGDSVKLNQVLAEFE